jgi:uncharacterized protein YyaL (SSP411 family)
MSRTALSCIALAALATVSCRKDAGTAAGPPPPVIAPELGANRLAGSGAGLLESRQDSPVKWQPWEPEVLRRAADARRLVLVLVGGSQYPGTVEALDAIDRDAELVRRLNEGYVPVLADVDLARETGLAAGLLSQEIRLPVSFPFLLVLSPLGHEVTWRPIAYTPAAGDFRQLFDGATDVISRMWAESPDYVLRNSMADHDNRLKRLPPPEKGGTPPETRDEFLKRAARQLVSQYDPDIGTLAGTGGLLPLGILQCLASSSQDPALPADLATRCGEAVQAFGAHVLDSAMIDPLDGGIYSTRRGNSWDLPMPLRTCATQARAIRALASLHSATGDPRALEIALGAAAFAAAEFTAADGLFANQRQPMPTPTSQWLWSKAQIDDLLEPREAALWSAYCGVKSLGNLAMEADPMREFFRLNSLGRRMSLADAAAAAQIDPAEAAGLLESGRRKLLAARLSRVPQPAAATAGLAAPSFRMVSAYAALFTATGEAAWRDKALALARSSREAFSADNLLVEQSKRPAAVADARAFTYALAIQAALDLAEITLDESWRIWAGDLATLVAEQFLDGDGRLREARSASTLLQLPVEDRMMLFDDSTAGVMRMNLARLDALGQSPPPELLPLVQSLPPIADYPVVFTDSILATSFARSRVIVELPAGAAAEWREAAAKLPLDRIARRLGKGGTARVLLPDGSAVPVESPAALRDAAIRRP